MISKIYKHALDITDEQVVTVPSGAQFLSVQIQKGSLCLWSLVYPDSPPEERRIRLIGTGHVIDDRDGLVYIGTVQCFDGSLVLHAFEVR